MAPHSWPPVSAMCRVHSRLWDMTRSLPFPEMLSFPFPVNKSIIIPKTQLRGHPLPTPFPGSLNVSLSVGGTVAHLALTCPALSLQGLSNSHVYRIIWALCEQKVSLDFMTRNSVTSWGSIQEPVLLQAPRTVLMEKMASCGKQHIQAEMVALTVLSPPVSSALSPNIGEGNDHPLQHSCLGNPMDREAWRATVHGVTGVTEVRHNLVT